MRVLERWAPELVFYLAQALALREQLLAVLPAE
jgi:hypothetical protein